MVSGRPRRARVSASTLSFLVGELTVQDLGSDAETSLGNHTGFEVHFAVEQETVAKIESHRHSGSKGPNRLTRHGPDSGSWSQEAVQA
jgi:hypothetical protein